MNLRQKPSLSLRVSTALLDDAGLADSILWIEERPEVESVFEKWVPNFDSNREQALLARSPARFAEDISNIPILLLHGTSDVKVRISQAEKMNNALLGLGKNVELVAYEGGDHSLSEFTKDATTRIRNLMDLHLASDAF